MNAEVDIDPDELAGCVTASREAFAAAYNTVAEAQPQPVDRFETIAVMRQRRAPIGETDKRAQADFAAALFKAREHGFLRALFLRFGERLFRATLPSGELLAGLFTPDAGAAETMRVVHQAIVTTEAFRLPDVVNAGLMTAQRRTCRVVITRGGERETGTGFLIGPRLVLTNWHVVRTLLVAMDAAEASQEKLATPEAWKPLAGSEANIRIEFDFNTSAAQQGGVQIARVDANWLVATSAAEGREHPGHNNPGVHPPWPANADDFAPYDDFAVIALAEPLGFERGFYDILNERPSKPAGNMVVFHHPGQFSMRLSEGKFIFAGPEMRFLDTPTGQTEARVLHDANVIGGSSGGPLFTWDMRPVALHQAGIVFGGPSDLTDDKGDAIPRAAINVAIPLTRIIDKAGDRIRGRMGSLRSLQPVLRDGRPLIARGDLQEAIAMARQGEKKIIVVRPDYDDTDERKPLSRVGKSFSKTILKEYVSHDAQHQVVEISAADLGDNAFHTAQAILNAVDSRRLSALAGLEATLTAARQSTEINDVVGRIVFELTNELIAAAGARTLWLVIDDLDKHPLAATSTRSLLDRLYSNVGAEPNLRLMLIGLMDADLPSLQAVRAKEVCKPLTHLGLNEVLLWLDRRVDGRTAISKVASRCLGNMVVSFAKRRVTDRLSVTESVAEVVSAHLETHLSSEFGQ